MDLGEVDNAVGENMFITVRLDDFSDKDIVFWEIDRFDELALHVNGALSDHGGCF